MSTLTSPNGATLADLLELKQSVGHQGTFKSRTGRERRDHSIVAMSTKAQFDWLTEQASNLGLSRSSLAHALLASATGNFTGEVDVTALTPESVEELTSRPVRA